MDITWELHLIDHMGISWNVYKYNMMSVYWVSHRGLVDIAIMSPGNHICVSLVSHGYLMYLSWASHGYLMYITWVSYVHHMGISWVSHGYLCTSHGYLCTSHGRLMGIALIIFMAVILLRGCLCNYFVLYDRRAIFHCRHKRGKHQSVSAMDDNTCIYNTQHIFGCLIGITWVSHWYHMVFLKSHHMGVSWVLHSLYSGQYLMRMSV